MFVQVIQGPVADREALGRLGERWERELRPGATGFLGATMGVTDDGWAVNIVRFESEQAARANSDRPEQGAWFAEAAKCYSAEPTFAESSDIDTFRGGGSDDAGFVQVMIGSTTDRSGMEALDKEFESMLDSVRPDLLGTVRVWTSPNEFIEAAYFTNEAEARANEAKEMPADIQKRWDEAMESWKIDKFLDLRDPQMV